jgi:hypothetical protein
VFDSRACYCHYARWREAENISGQVAALGKVGKVKGKAILVTGHEGP